MKSRTGNGETTSSTIPIIQDLIQGKRSPQALVLSPTRESVLRIKGEFDNIGAYKRIRTITVLGKQPSHFQVQDVKQRTYIVAGAPGRVLDHLEQETLRTEKIRYTIIDEADKMLNMRLIKTVQKVFFHLPEGASVYMFSATLPQEIQELTHDFLRQVEVAGIESRASISEQIHHYAYHSKEHEKPQALLKLSCRRLPESCIISAKTQEYACGVCRTLCDKGISANQLRDDILQED